MRNPIPARHHLLSHRDLKGAQEDYREESNANVFGHNMSANQARPNPTCFDSHRNGGTELLIVREEVRLTKLLTSTQNTAICVLSPTDSQH